MRLTLNGQASTSGVYIRATYCHYVMKGNSVLFPEDKNMNQTFSQAPQSFHSLSY